MNDEVKQPTPSAPPTQQRTFWNGCAETWAHILFPLMILCMVGAVGWMVYDIGRQHGRLQGWDEKREEIKELKANVAKAYDNGHRDGYRLGFNDRSRGIERRH